MAASDNDCARRLRLLEREEFLAVGDAAVAKYLRASSEAKLREGKAESLPDLLSLFRGDAGPLFRLREVKFRLESRLIHKAISQLESGAHWLGTAYPSAVIDRMEIVVPLGGRALKATERVFLGDLLSGRRYLLAGLARESTIGIPFTVCLL